MAISSMDVSGHHVERSCTWLVALGGSLILLGIVAVGSSLATTYASMLVLAVILLFGAAIRIVASFTARDWTGSLLLILSGVLYLVAAILTFKHPVAAALALTLLFSALLLAIGLFRVIGAVWYRFDQWGWVALSGAISVLLGLMLWNSWPVSGLWFIGFCIGVDLIAEGAGWIALSWNSDGDGSAPKSAA